VKSRIITLIPTYNSGTFLAQTLESIAKQVVRPDRVIVLDDGSTDDTLEIVRCFRDFHCELVRNRSNPGLFQNFNRCLEFAGQTEYLQILHADDTLKPRFYEIMTGVLSDCEGRGMAWSLDERIDESGRHLSDSGRSDGIIETLTPDEFLRRKAEIGNQAFCATLLKTACQPVPCQFPVDMPILGDMIFWAAYGAHCRKIVHVHQTLGNYRWHGANQTVMRGTSIQSLILDEWRTMETNELLRGKGWSLKRKLKLKGLLAVRSGIKAKRVRQNGDAAYAGEITTAARAITGWCLWLAGAVIVELRDIWIFGVRRRRRHPKNIYG
jgi:glycosyltransferase involved in cell wall biosynthesis